uniref:RING-type domain-containing protein n=1 Tax=Steinernema glaseri TaxID=37863 RepID=A0A1I7ZLM5_9BILA
MTERGGQSHDALFRATLRSGRPIGNSSTPRAKQMARMSSAGLRLRYDRGVTTKRTVPVQTSKKTNKFVVSQDQVERFKKDTAEILVCAICSALLYRPMVLSPCGDKFCSSCVARLFEVTLEKDIWEADEFVPSCPTCLHPISTASTDGQTSRMLDKFLEMFPDLKPNAETCAAKDQNDFLYKSGGSIFRPPMAVNGVRFAMNVLRD